MTEGSLGASSEVAIDLTGLAQNNPLLCFTLPSHREQATIDSALAEIEGLVARLRSGEACVVPTQVGLSIILDGTMVRGLLYCSNLQTNAEAVVSKAAHQEEGQDD